jgi:hypothetical protein
MRLIELHALRVLVISSLVVTAACTGVDKVFAPTPAPHVFEPSFTPEIGPSLTFLPEPTSSTQETTPSPNGLQNVEIATAKNPEAPIVSQEYLDQEGVFAASSIVKKIFLSWQRSVVSTPDNAKTWGILSTDQSGHKYLTTFFETLDGGIPISEYLLIPVNEIFFISPLQHDQVAAPNGGYYAALVDVDPDTNKLFQTSKPYIWTTYSSKEISGMTSEEQANIPVYFSAFGQIDGISLKQEAVNETELRQVLLTSIKLTPTPTITPDLTPIENISPQNEGIVNLLKNYVLPNTGTDKNIGPQIILRVLNAMNRGEIISFETLHEQVNASGKPIIVDGVNIGKYPSLCVSEEQNNVFWQQGVSVIVFHDGVKLTQIYDGKTILVNTGYMFGKPFGPTIGISIMFTQESITQSLVKPGCSGYLLPPSHDVGILITPYNYSFEDFVAELQQVAPIGCNESYCSFLTAINNLSSVQLFNK